MTGTEKRIAEIDTRWAKATPGKWTVDSVTPHKILWLTEKTHLIRVASVNTKFPNHMQNAEAIASAPSDIAYLRSVIDRQREELEAVEKAFVERLVEKMLKP